MAFKLYMNMESLSIKIINSNIDLIGNNNLEEDGLWLKSEIQQNMEYGTITLIQMITLIDSYLSSALNLTNHNIEDYKSMDIHKKFNLLYKYKKREFNDLKKTESWKTFIKIKEIRNFLVHFNSSFIGYAGGIYDFTIGDSRISQIFTKANFIIYKNNIFDLIKNISADFNLIINFDAGIIASEGMSYNPTFLCKEYFNP